jgi:hypothetical protein
LGGLFETIIVGALLAWLIEGGIVGAAAQAVAHKVILDLCFSEGAGQQLAVELVCPTAVGLAAHVDDECDTVLSQQL